MHVELRREYAAPFVTLDAGGTRLADGTRCAMCVMHACSDVCNGGWDGVFQTEHLQTMIIARACFVAMHSCRRSESVMALGTAAKQRSACRQLPMWSRRECGTLP
jgi:hypothetical protein